MDKIPTKDLIAYVRSELINHTPPDKIVENLSVAGWPAETVKKIIGDVGRPKSREWSVPKKHHPVIHRIVKIVILAVVTFLVIAYILGGS
jgi:hypothetical protein